MHQLFKQLALLIQLSVINLYSTIEIVSKRLNPLEHKENCPFDREKPLAEPSSWGGKKQEVVIYPDFHIFNASSLASG